MGKLHFVKVILIQSQGQLFCEGKAGKKPDLVNKSGFFQLYSPSPGNGSARYIALQLYSPSASDIALRAVKEAKMI